MSNRSIAVHFNGEVYYTDGSVSLAELLGIERSCSGRGVCGACRIVAHGKLSPLTDTERRLLSSEEISRGVRLACRTYAQGECEAELLSKEGELSVLLSSVEAIDSVSADFVGYGAAVDIGTTTIAARLYNSEGRLLSSAGSVNPQVSLGADVISRIDAALSGKREELVSSVRTCVKGLLVALCDDAKMQTGDIQRVVMTGNTVMLSFLADRDVEPFSHAPFLVEHLFGECVLGSELGITEQGADTVVYISPCISAFVGADVVCGILSTGLDAETGSMLVDVGTNGEMALWNGKRIIASATAAGPAFEGVGISSGMRGCVGAVDRVSVKDGALYSHVIGDTEPKGICGSGLIDALSCMLELGIVDGSGFLEESPYTVSPGVSLSRRDIRMLQLAKSAICAGILTILDSERMDARNVPKLYLAGGFGSYMDKRSAARIGLFPKVLLPVTKSVGNSALEGAAMLLLNDDLRAKASELSRSARVVDLATNSEFSEYFTCGMAFDED